MNSIHALAWPIVVGVIVVVGMMAMTGLLGRLRVIRWRHLEVIFESSASPREKPPDDVA